MPTLVASPTSPKAHAEISAVPDSSNPTAPTPVTLNAISQAEWDAVPSKQRPVQFKAHIDQVHAHWNTILNCLDEGCKHTETQLSALRANATLHELEPEKYKAQLDSLTQQLELRKNAWQRIKSYVSDQTSPKMLDLFYLNQTRQHLQTIAETTTHPALSNFDQLAELVELSHGLGVCKEGVALNIMECAAQMHRKSLPNKLQAMYEQSREELLHQLLLRAVRTSHANEIPPQTESGGQKTGILTNLYESQSLTMKSTEIHDVQALRNALSDTLGLPYVADRHISRKYQSEVGAVAREVIPGLLTKRAVTQFLAEKIQTLAKEELTKDNPNLSLLNELLTREFGVSAHAVYNCDECKPLEFKEIEKNLFTQLFKDAKIEDHAAKPTPAEETHAMHAFLGKGRLTSGRDTISARRFFDHAITASVAANNAAQKDPLTDEEKKRQAQERLHVMRDSIHRATQHLTDG